MEEAGNQLPLAVKEAEADSQIHVAGVAAEAGIHWQHVAGVVGTAGVAGYDQLVDNHELSPLPGIKNATFRNNMTKNFVDYNTQVVEKGKE